MILDADLNIMQIYRRKVDSSKIHVSQGSNIGEDISGSIDTLFELSRYKEEFQ